MLLRISVRHRVSVGRANEMPVFMAQRMINQAAGKKWGQKE
jgi:hypothetical protein